MVYGIFFKLLTNCLVCFGRKNIKKVKRNRYQELKISYVIIYPESGRIYLGFLSIGRLYVYLLIHPFSKLPDLEGSSRLEFWIPSIKVSTDRVKRSSRLTNQRQPFSRL